MKRKLLVVVMFVLLFGLVKVNVRASGFGLTSIGSVNTSGRQISHWWYTASNPTFVGEALAGAEVSISIDGAEASVNADSDGKWTYSSGSLSGGDHSVSVSSNGSTVSFTLTIGTENVNWDAVNAGSGATLPSAGTVLPTIILSVSGLTCLFGAKKMLKRN